MLKKLGLLTLSSVAAFAMHTAEININNQDLELVGKLDVGQINRSVEPGTMFVGLKLLNGHEDHSSEENIENGSYLDLNFLMMNKSPIKGLSIGLGVKLNYSDSFDKDYVSVPLGIELKYKLPATNLIPLYLGGNAYYAPSVLSMSDAEDFLEYRAYFDLEVIRSGSLTLGYRYIETNYSKVEYTYNKSAYIGFKFAF